MSAIEAKPTVEGPKRADARRNRERVLAAAREAFAEGGKSTALEQIALVVRASGFRDALPALPGAGRRY